MEKVIKGGSLENTVDEIAKEIIKRDNAVSDESIAAVGALQEEVSSVKSAITQLDNNVITESAGPAPIVSIKDGADGMPLRSLSVAVEPVQDLHGYDAPWPGGGGKNLFDPALLKDQGTWNTFSIQLEQNTVYTMSTNLPQSLSGQMPLYFFRDDGNPGASTLVRDTTPITLTSSDTGIMKIQQRVVSGSDSFLNYNWQIEKGSTASSYAPYSNICPISGHTGAVVTRTGKNLLAPSACTPKKFIRSDGTAGNSDNWSISDFIPVKAWQTYTISGVVNAGDVAYHAFYDGSKTFKTAVLARTHATFTVPDDASFVRLSMNKETPDTVQLELGSTASGFVPFEEIDFVQIPFGQTVYGGNLTLHQDGSGELVVDRAMVSADSLTWSEDARRNRWLSGTVANIKPISGDTVLTTVVSDTFKAFTNNQIYDNTALIGFAQNGSSIVVRNGTTATRPVGCVFVYELATSVTIPLSASQITTLLGHNNIFADCGDVSVTYPADTKLYVDGQQTEDDMTANANIPNGYYFQVGNTLYKATAAIAQGETIIPGTNCTKTTFAEALNLLAAQ